MQLIRWPNQKLAATLLLPTKMSLLEELPLRAVASPLLYPPLFLLSFHSPPGWYMDEDLQKAIRLALELCV